MSLDSVHLILELENYFQVQFNDAEAEKVVTIQDCVALIWRLRGIADAPDQLRERVGDLVQVVLRDMGLLSEPAAWDDPIFRRLDPQDPMRWEQFCTRMELVIPKPHLGKDTPKRGLFGPIVDYIWHVSYEHPDLTFDQFVTAICIANHKKLVDPQHLHSAFEVYVAVAAVTIECTGVDVYEIGPEKRFADDLGID